MKEEEKMRQMEEIKDKQKSIINIKRVKYRREEYNRKMQKQKVINNIFL